MWFDGPEEQDVNEGRAVRGRGLLTTDVGVITVPGETNALTGGCVSTGGYSR